MKQGNTSVRMWVKPALVLLALCLALLAAILLMRGSITLSGNNRAASSNSDGVNAEAAVAAALLENAGLSLPAREGAWLIVSHSGGGPAGKSDAAVVITSEGNVAAGGPSGPGEFRLPCKAHISADELRKFEQIVLSADPINWRGRYIEPASPDGCCDQYFYMLEFQRRKPDGTKQIQAASWYDSSAFLRPRDLISIHEAAVTIKNDALKKCQP
ncbi:MAG TPA: hypothetical protein VM911_07690 [Pyrinomonadaceae bacterium]|jgi:hypothetical protein|nr:hypothetical protein [Pyrinomonadaceae bacterium]